MQARITYITSSKVSIHQCMRFSNHHKLQYSLLIIQNTETNTVTSDPTFIINNITHYDDTQIFQEVQYQYAHILQTHSMRKYNGTHIVSGYANNKGTHNIRTLSVLFSY